MICKRLYDSFGGKAGEDKNALNTLACLIVDLLTPF